MEIIIDGMHGLGDNLFQRAALKQSTQSVYLRTPWPEIYSDLPHVRPLRADSRLRTQRISELAADAGMWSRPPECGEVIGRRVKYGARELDAGSVPGAISACLGVPEGRMDLPPLPELRISVPRPYAVVRPVSVRAEWLNLARNPLPQVVADVARELRAAGYYVVSVGHISPPAEVLVEPRPQADLELLYGELSTLQLLALVAGASVVAGGVGWIVPAAFASGVPLIGILGGQGGHNAPEKVTPVPHKDHPALWIYPDNFCCCANMRHDCQKDTTDAAGKSRRWIESQLTGVRVAA